MIPWVGFVCSRSPEWLLRLAMHSFESWLLENVDHLSGRMLLKSMVYSTSMISQRFLPSWAHADMHNAHQMILSLEHDHELNTKERRQLLWGCADFFWLYSSMLREPNRTASDTQECSVNVWKGGGDASNVYIFCLMKVNRCFSLTMVEKPNNVVFFSTS